jgi:hypothetical protein
VAHVRRLAVDARAALAALAREGEAAQARPRATAAAGAPPAPAERRDATHPAVWFFAGAAMSALGFSLAVLVRLVGAR